MHIGAKLNIEKLVASMRRYRCWKKINVKACNVVFTLITLKQHSFIVETFEINKHFSILKQDAQLSQRDCAAGCVIVFAKSRTLELGDNDLRTL